MGLQCAEVKPSSHMRLPMISGLRWPPLNAVLFTPPGGCGTEGVETISTPSREKAKKHEKGFDWLHTKEAQRLCHVTHSVLEPTEQRRMGGDLESQGRRELDVREEKGTRNI